ncbi:MAG: insulinase family protein, partial [Candidatus Zixiibacteriota bacterium]
MHRMRIVIITALLVALVIPVAAQDISKLKFPQLHSLKLPKVKEVTLDNGMRLYIVEDHSLPTFSLSARINCGSYLEPDDKVGLASICGTVLRTGGTKKWPGDTLDEKLEAVGASVETSIGLLSGNASVNSLSDYQDMVLDILADILRNPVFDQDKIDLAKVQA